MKKEKKNTRKEQKQKATPLKTKKIICIILLILVFIAKIILKIYLTEDLNILIILMR